MADEITDENITSDLAGARSRAGLTQTALARRVGVSQSYVALIESGRRTMPAARVDDFKAVLNAALAKRLADQEVMRSAVRSVMAWTDEDERRLAERRAAAEARLGCE